MHHLSPGACMVKML